MTPGGYDQTDPPGQRPGPLPPPPPAGGFGTAAPSWPTASGPTPPPGQVIPPGQPASVPTSSFPASPLATSALPGVPFPMGPVPPGTPPTAPGARRSPVLAILLALLAVVVIVQAGFLLGLNGKLSHERRQAAEDRAAAGKRDDALDARVKALEQRAAQSLDTAGVSAAVLPSVFRVDAGDFSGTAFAIGKPASGGGTNLLTNFHVVSEIYKSGDRDVTLTHSDQRFPATIVRVDEDKDIAMLHADESFDRLSAAPDPVRTGAPILVIGAPLGLAQSVTSGVVSAVRHDFPGEAGKTYIQFSAPINPGNSGGPVVDAQKRVVGIATAKATDAEGIGLAIPIEVACDTFSIC